MSGAVSARMADGRLHLQHGPIDLIIGVDGSGSCVRAAEAAMESRFATVLDELVQELAELRRDVHDCLVVSGAVAKRMHRSVKAAAGTSFLTPMAAVAGAVADEIADAGWNAAELRRLHVNNGGDIAIRQVPSETVVVGVIDNVATGNLAGRMHISGQSGIGGAATGGCGGRSFSLGIADAVTVLASDTALADAVATVVANAVNLPHHRSIERRPASSLRSDSDLEDRLVTYHVGSLSDADIDSALSAGGRCAEDALARNQAAAVLLMLRGRRVIVGDSPAFAPARASRRALDNAADRSVGGVVDVVKEAPDGSYVRSALTQRPDVDRC